MKAWIGWVLALVGLGGCSLDKVIEVKLPPYERKLVAECYLEAGKPVQVLLTESQSYFDSLKINLINNASVVVQGGDVPDTLQQSQYFDLENKKLYNYSAYLSDGVDTNRNYSIEIRDKQGRVLKGSTSFLPKPRIDSIVVRYDADRDSAAGIIVWMKDFAGQANYYRIVLNEDSLSGAASLDFTFTDNLGDGKEIPIGTSYRFKKKQTLYIRMFHIEKQYYDYLESLQDANRANGNPFAQPAIVKSAMEGGYGIFTTLNYRLFNVKT